ncbi:MAG: hypothetical protein KJO84_08145, partial [Acidimicrobiia bacterium]|nr:hypothetical protein [Acidimicrobiia bacterium]
MKAVVLGSGQDGGVPQLFGPDRPHRTTASLAIVTGSGTVLIDCGPDIRSQHQALTSLVGTDQARVAGVALTHG